MDGIECFTKLSEAERAVVADDLRAGLGVEDVAVLRGHAADDIRACVQYWRRMGRLSGILRVDPTRHAETLRTMGLRE